MKVLIVGVTAAYVAMFSVPFGAALILAGLLVPAAHAEATAIPCTSSLVDTITPPEGIEEDPITGGEGGLDFPLPPAGEPRKASIRNPPLPIPDGVLALYQQAAREYRLPWTLLAGIGMAETNHGRLRATSSAGARGLMQFMPATFASYGIDGDSDHRADISNDADSIYSAANYLTASGVHHGPEGVRDALFAYNRAWWYVNDVLSYAHAYGGGQVTTAPGQYTPCVPAVSLIDGDIPQSDRDVGSEYRLTLATIVVKRAVAAQFPTITTFGGWRASSKISTSDHPHGKGLDVMISHYRDPAQIALGDAIAEYLITNHDLLKIKYVIWKQRSWSPERPYWRPMADRGSATDNHHDHVHISVLE